jgi:hypothetical protein
MVMFITAQEYETIGSQVINQRGGVLLLFLEERGRRFRQAEQGGAKV